MSDEDWDAGLALRVGLFLNGEAIADRDRRGQRVTDDSFLLLFNAHHRAIKWTLPRQWAEWWEPIFDTSALGRRRKAIKCGQARLVAGRSVVVLRRQG